VGNVREIIARADLADELIHERAGVWASAIFLGCHELPQGVDDERIFEWLSYR
jgi:hypothetical protein